MLHFLTTVFCSNFSKKETNQRKLPGNLLFPAYLLSVGRNFLIRASVALTLRAASRRPNSSILFVAYFHLITNTQAHLGTGV